MPYFEDGLVPDLLVNSHSIPTRMAINQIIECTMAQLAVARGHHVDGTMFSSVDLNACVEELKNEGIEWGGHRRARCGKTGQYLDTLVFVGPTTYQRIQKFAMDENYAMRKGPTNALVNQPLSGKANNGGLKVGEMEKDVICAHGTMKMLNDKFYVDSDGANIYICRNCGNRAFVNEKVGFYSCKKCEDLADIAEVPSSWVANLLFNECSAMNVNLKFNLESRMLH
jgi:DNA-directed RNA polymerase II subunit RPB2